MQNKGITLNRQSVQSKLLNLYPVIIFAFVVVFFEILSKGKIHQLKYIKVIWESSYNLIIGCLMALFLYAEGEIDFSMGSTIGLAGICAAYLTKVSLPLAFIAAIVIGTLVGLLNGFIYAKYKIPVFFLTFCVANIIYGMLPLLSHHTTVACNLAIMKVNNLYIKIAAVAVTLVVVYFLYNKSMFGKVCRAIGANPEAVRQSGIREKKYIIMSFVFTGFVCGVLALFEIAKTCGAQQDTGNMFHFNILIAMTLGGSSGGGARVKLWSAILGPLILSVLTCGMNIAGVATNWQCIVKGVIFLTVLWANYRFDKSIVE